jgi:hypothetical protein
MNRPRRRVRKSLVLKAEGTGLEPVSAFRRGGFQVLWEYLRATTFALVPL